MTQEILSAMSSDEVNSISDTAESLQVATIIKRKYYDILSRGNIPENDQLFNLNPSLDETKPVLMFVPNSINKIHWIKYRDTNPLDSLEQDQFTHDVNTDIVDTPGPNPASSPTYKYVTILPLEQFLNMTNSFNTNDSDVESFTFTETGSLFTFNYKNDHQPNYCTILSNFYIIFDMFDNTQDTTLQAAKTLCYGQYITPFNMEDTFIPDLNDNQFPLLVNEAKALAFYELKQQPHMKAEQEIKRQWTAVQKNKSVINRPTYFDELANFGRTPNTGGYGGRIRRANTPQS